MELMAAIMGLETLSEPCDVILITAFADMETAIDALRGGASEPEKHLISASRVTDMR